MGKTVTVTCDGCGRDLTTRTNCVDYRLVLAAEGKPGHGDGFYTAAMIYPPVDRAYYFCALKCLDHWRSREHHKADLWKTWHEKWKDEHGTRDEEGRIWSYPCTPEDLRVKLNAQFEAAALVAFPMTAPRSTT